MFESAFWILASVISRPATDRVVLDAGRKAVSFEPGGTPIIEDPTGLEIESLSEEHAKVSLTSQNSDLQPGQKVRITPWHGCTTFNLHDTVYVVQDDEVVDVWSIAGRGKFT